MANPRLEPWTIHDLERLPDDEFARYEIIGGELFVSRLPGNRHQYACTEAVVDLGLWSEGTGNGVALYAPGVIFSETNTVQLDVVWLSHERLAQIEGDDDHLHGAPELVVEVLSPGAKNEQRDRDRKLRLYSHYGVDEYWMLDPRARQVEIYRRPAAGARASSRLRLVATLGVADTLTSPFSPASPSRSRSSSANPVLARRPLPGLS
jgi:Uma2 family endonuclease